ncbi:MAG: phage/plasmid primase, P4 family [Oscillospiraceae bacterium]
MKYEKIPIELKSLPRWVCFKKDKSPINPNTGGGAMSNNSGTWASFEQAVKGEKLWDCKGIGFMLGDGIVGIDLDHCYDPDTGELTEKSFDIVNTVSSYTEFSPSGTGLHILCKGELPKGKRRKDGLEIYDKGRYFTVTGNVFNGITTINDCTASIASVHEKYLGGEELLQTQQLPLKPVELEDGEILNLAFSSKDGVRFRSLYSGAWQGYYSSQSEADLGFCNMLCFWFGANEERVDRIFRGSGLYRKKWDEMRGAQKYSAYTIQKAIKDCKEVYTPKPKVEAFEDAQEFFKKNSAPTTPFKEKKRYSLDDTGNALRFRDFAKDMIRYNHTDKAWYTWDGTRWHYDGTESIKRIADKMLLEMDKDIFGLQDKEEIMAVKAHIRRSKSSKGKQAFIVETQHLEGVAVEPKDLDRHKGLFNLANGTLNLKTGKVGVHKKIDNITKRSEVSYDKNAQCPVWLKFLGDITNNDIQLIDYLQCLLGYCLSGSTREQCMFFLYGSGANGKSTFLEVVRDILGDYAMNTQAETLMMRERSSGGARSDIARLKGARLVTTSETEEGAALNEGLVKQLTGGDSITARFLYGKDFEFRPEFKIIMATNHKPKIKGTDNGIWRRVRLVPFEVSIPADKQDRNLSTKLKQELSGILNWAIEGTVKWQENSKGTKSGLPVCRAVDAAIDEYKTEMDRLAQFIEECVVNEEGKTLQASSFYKMYTGWAKANGEKFPFTAQKFGREMQKRYKTRKSSVCTEYLDLGATRDGVRHLFWGTGANEDFYKAMKTLEKPEKPVEQLKFPKQ